MKVLIINTLYSPFKVGGAEVSVQLLAEELAKKKIDVHIATLVPRGSKYAHTSATVNNVRVHYLPLLSFYWPFENEKRNPFLKLAWHLLDNSNPLMYRQLKKLISSIQPTVIHTNNLSGFSAGTLKFIKTAFPKLKLVHTARDYFFYDFRTTLFRNGQIIYKSNIKSKICILFRVRYLKYIDDFIGISNYIYDFHKDELDKFGVNGTVVYNPIDLDLNINSGFQSIGRGNSLKFGFLGRRTIEKGYDDFVRLASELETVYSDSNMKPSFFVAGRGENEFLKRVHDQFGNPKIIDLGFVNPADFFSKVDVLIVPIKWLEPFGRTLVEASSYGVPFVGYGVAGAKELYEILGEKRLECKDYDDLMSVSCKLIKREFSVNSVDNIALRFFSTENHVSAMLKLMGEN